MSLERRTEMRSMSAKRRQELAEAGNTNPWSTLTNSTAGRGSVSRPAVPAQRKPPVYTGPSAGTVALLFERDHGRCARDGRLIVGERGRDWSVQHRRARQGRDSRPDTNQPQNLILLCGSATSPHCHFWVESNRTAARDNGWAIRQTDTPAEMPVNHAVHGWVLLTPAGAFTTYSPNHNHQTEGATA